RDKRLDIRHARLPAEASGPRRRAADPTDDLVRARRRHAWLLQRDPIEQAEPEQRRWFAPRRSRRRREFIDAAGGALQPLEDMPAAGIGDALRHDDKGVRRGAAAARLWHGVTAETAMLIEAHADPVMRVPRARELLEPVLEDFPVRRGCLGARLAEPRTLALCRRSTDQSHNRQRGQ